MAWGSAGPARAAAVLCTLPGVLALPGFRGRGRPGAPSPFQVRPPARYPSPRDANLSFNASALLPRPFEGFGAMVWADQSYGLSLFRDLNIRFIRTTQDGTSRAQMQQMRNLTDTLGIKQMYVQWSAPRNCTANKMLSNVDCFADYWLELVRSLDGDGLRPHYLDLMNEPDSGGSWSTGIAPAQYSELVVAVRGRLDAAGFADVGIAGPGLTHLDWGGHATEWIAALNDTAVAALSSWATHAWDDGDICHGGASCMVADWGRDFGKAALARTLPGQGVWVTEYATKEFTLHGRSYPDPDDTAGYSSADSMAYAARVYQNTLAMLNCGATAAFYWEAEDQETKSWGYVTRNGTHKPVLQALLALYPKLPVGARVARSPPAPATGTEGIYGTLFVAGEALIVALANDAVKELNATVRITGARGGLRVSEAIAVMVDTPGDPAKHQMDTAQTVPATVTLQSEGTAAYTLSAALAGDSVLTAVLR